MRVGWCTIAIMTAGLGPVAAARADGVCVRIDRARDSLTAAEQRGLRVAIEAALEREGVAVERAATTGGAPGAPGDASLEPPCPAGLSAYAIRLGAAVTVTLALGDGKVSGRAASLDEVDLLVSQLVRSLVTGRSLATGSGVTDRANALRDQTAPRRVDAGASRRWDPMLAIGGGMLQLPAHGDRARQRQYDIVSIESRWWGFLTGERSALEIAGRLLLHDYAAIGAADAAYERARDAPGGGQDGGRLAALVFSPLAVANYEAGLGVVVRGAARAPRPYLRVGATMSILCRPSDPDHRVDVGVGGYVGVGVELSSRLGLSIAAHGSNPVVHDFLGSGYRYFLTTTALLEIRGEARPRRLPRAIGPEPRPVIRRIDE